VALHPPTPLRARLAWVGLLLVLAVPLWWGAHASFPWDLDNIAPGSVLKAMAARFGPGWYSSYGPVPYLLTAFVYAPLLALMRLAGELGRPAAAYPFGFRHPEASITALVVAARLVTLALALGLAALAACTTRVAPRAAAERRPGARPWLVPVLLAGSAVFVYYARTSNVDLHALFWAWLAFALVETPAPSLARCAGAAAAAALAVCSKEQLAPFAAVAGLVACARAWAPGAPGRRRGAGAVALVLAAGLAAYALVWMLPLNLPGWLAHHRFLFETAKYPRTFAATLEGYGALARRCFELAPLAFGWPVLLGLVAAVMTRPGLRGLGPRALGAALYLAAFIGSIGYVYPRFLLPLLLLVLPIALRGLEAALGRMGPRGGVALAGALVVLALAGGPALDLVMLQDPRLVVERWLATRAPAGALVEIAGNPHFQARVPATRRRLVTSPDSLRLRPRDPAGDVVLVSSLDEYALRRLPGDAYLRALETGDAYRLELEAHPPALARLFEGLPVAPEVRVYVRAAAVSP